MFMIFFFVINKQKFVFIKYEAIRKTLKVFRVYTCKNNSKFSYSVARVQFLKENIIL